MQVTNINGTTNNQCKCGDWLSHWKKYSGQTTQFCSEVKCLGKDLVGAHVQKAASADKNWYIIPLCNACNCRRGATLSVGDHVKLVPANVGETCGK